MTDSELIKAINEIDNSEEIYSLKKEQVENFGFDTVPKKGFLFFICIKENIENDSWFSDIFNGYNILCEDLDLDLLYNQKEKDYEKNCIIRLGLILLETCEDYFVSNKISELEMSERIDTIIDIQQYLLYARTAKLLGITLNSTKEDLGSFFSYFTSCYKKWLNLFPSELPYLKGFKNIFEIEFSNERLLEDVTFDKSMVDIFFKRITFLILSNRNILSSSKKGELIDLEETKRKLIFASYEIGLSSLGDNQDLNSTIELLNKWIKLEKEFIETTPPFPLINQSEEESFKFTNNFDRVNLNEFTIYEYFQTELVETDFLSQSDLDKYLIYAFQKQAEPEIKFTIYKDHNIEDIRKIFYYFYNVKAGRPYGQKRKYAGLLGKYFVGFDTQRVYNNFNR
jgi:hypothetical protein